MLFEGSERAVGAQLETARALVGGEAAGTEVWDESRRRQGESRGRILFDPGRLGDALAGLEEAIVRPAAGVAYTPSDTAPPADEGVRKLVERIARELDPGGVLAG